MVLRPIAEILTEMPVTNDPIDGNAGPPFELYGDLQLSTQESNRWIILNERLDSIIMQAKDLSDIDREIRIYFGEYFSDQE